MLINLAVDLNNLGFSIMGSYPKMINRKNGTESNKATLRAEITIYSNAICPI